MSVAALPPLDVAVVFGSGLAVVPNGLIVEAELGYDELGWPVTGVGGHASRLLVARRERTDGVRPEDLEGRGPGEASEHAAWAC